MSGSRDAGNRARSWGVDCSIFGCRYVLTNFMVRGMSDTHEIGCLNRKAAGKGPPKRYAHQENVRHFTPSKEEVTH